jgi:peptide/nickel transport system permease protein
MSRRVAGTLVDDEQSGPGAEIPDAGQPRRSTHPTRTMVLRRSGSGVITIAVVAMIVYFATLVLPGDAAQAILGKGATPGRLAILRQQLHLNESPWIGFLHWSGDAVQGNFGTSLTNSQGVVSYVMPRIFNSVVLLIAAAVVSSVLGVFLGALAASRRDRLTDHVTSVLALVGSALPEFVVGIFVVLVFAIKLGWFPALSILPPNTSILRYPTELVLPVMTLVIVITPYVFRMSRASIIEALHSDYAELAQLKGASQTRLLFRHALPNAMAPTVQVIGLNLLYLAGGVVLVETVFQYPGVGLTLVSAVNDRDVPTIQFIVVVLSAFYVVLNIVTDVVVRLLTPRRRLPR